MVETTYLLLLLLLFFFHFPIDLSLLFPHKAVKVNHKSQVFEESMYTFFHEKETGYPLVPVFLSCLSLNILEANIWYSMVLHLFFWENPFNFVAKSHDPPYMYFKICIISHIHFSRPLKIRGKITDVSI